MALAEDFIAKFHAIDGQLLRQRQANLYKLLKEFEPLKDNTEALDTISATLMPKNYLESLFKVDFLIYFKRVPELFEYLKEGNDVYAGKIVKQNWLFKSAFNETPVDQLVNEILPIMSYSVRAKILKNLSKNSSVERFDLIFDALVARYGIFFASNYLLGCSNSKIKTILIDYKINDLFSSQLKILYNKNPDLVRQYFENYKLDNIKQDKFLRFLYKEDINLYKELEAKFKFNLKLGRRRTKKFVITHKEDIIKKPIAYIDKLDMRAVFRKLGAESETLIINTLPSKIQDIHNETNDFKKIKQFIPSKYLYKIYFKTIQNHYKQKFSDHSDLIIEDLIKIIPDQNERIKLAKIKFEESTDNFGFVTYFPSEEAIRLIKAKINLTSSDRSTLVVALVKTCGVNKDLKSFLQVLKYFYARHKNDEKRVIINFLNSIRRHFDFKEFNEEIWIALRDIMAVYTIKYEVIVEGSVKEILSKATEPNPTLHSELLMFCCNPVYGESAMLRMSYLEYMFKHGKLTEETILNYLCCANICFWGRKDYDLEFIMHLIKIAVANLEKIAKVRNSELKDYAFELIWLLEDKFYSDMKITLYDFPILVEYFYKIINAERYILYIFRWKLREKLFSLGDNPYKARNLEIYCGDLHKNFFQFSDFKWFLLYEPHVLLENFDKLKSSILDGLIPSSNLMGNRAKIHKDRKSIIHCFKKYSHLGLDQLVIHHCKSILQNDPDKAAAICCLSILLPSQEYIDIANVFKPTSTKIDLKDDSAKDYQVIFNIAENFKYTNDYKALDSLLNYFCSDFLEYALFSFSALIFKTPEIQLEKYLGFLRNNPAISMRKHFFFFTSLLCDSNTTEKMFKSVAANEKNESLQRRFFYSLINHFARNPEERYYEIAKTYFNFIKGQDRQLLRKIKKVIPKISLKYRAAFLMYFWEYLEKIMTKPKDLRELKLELLGLVDSQCASNITPDFANKIIQQNLPKTDENSIPQDKVVQFAFTLLTSRANNIQILDTIFAVINTTENPRELYWIHNKWTYEILKLKKEQNIDFLQHYITYWRSRLDPLEDFKGHLYLYFVQLKAEFHTEFSLEKISDKIIQFYEQVISYYGLCVLKILKEALEELLQYFTTDDITDYHFYYYIITNCKSTAIVIMITDILPCKEETNSNKFALYKKIVDKIKSLPSPAIKINATKFYEHE